MRAAWAMLAVGSLAMAVRADDLAVDRWRRADARTQALVLSLARRAFDAYALRREVMDPPRTLPPLLRERAAVFVSAMRRGAPRCCMGTLYPAEANAAREVITNAVAAAGRDRRFPPVKPEELRGLILIVSIVGRPRPIAASELEHLDPARDGLAVKSGDKWGVTLSGETNHVERMVKWARIRAGASEHDPVELFRLEVVRFVEKRLK
jgi:AMMECR1 domain-containing protein